MLTLITCPLHRSENVAIYTAVIYNTENSYAESWSISNLYGYDATCSSGL